MNPFPTTQPGYLPLRQLSRGANRVSTKSSPFCLILYWRRKAAAATWSSSRSTSVGTAPSISSAPSSRMISAAAISWNRSRTAPSTHLSSPLRRRKGWRWTINVSRGERQRLGEAEVALLVAFAQIETVRVVALDVGGKLGHFCMNNGRPRLKKR